MNIDGFLGQVEEDLTEDLSFIDGLDTVEELLDVVDGLGRVASRRRTSPRARSTAIRGGRKAASRAKTIAQKAPSNSGGKKEDENELSTIMTMMQNRIPDIESDKIRELLAKGKLTVVDTDLYSTRLAVSGTTRMTETSLNRTRGVRNFGKAVLPAGSVMLVTHIGLFSGVCSAPTGVEDKDAAVTEFTPISNTSDITLLNAEFNLQQGLKPLQTDRSVQAFLDNQTNEPEGYVKLKRAILLQDAQEIAADIVTAENAAYTANTYLRVVFRGVITIKR